jgi:hypothetical protein
MRPTCGAELHASGSAAKAPIRLRVRPHSAEELGADGQDTPTSAEPKISAQHSEKTRRAYTRRVAIVTPDQALGTWIGTTSQDSVEMEHEAGVEPACFGFKAQRGCRQPTARVLDQAAGIGPAWAAFRAQLGYQQPTPE